MSFTPFDPDLAKLIANLPQASTVDLYRIEVAVRKLRSEPQRILEVRRHLHLGMTVHFMSEHDAAMHTGRIVAMRERDLTIDDANRNTRWSGVPYAAIDLGATQTVEILDDAPRPKTASRRATRANFKLGDGMSYDEYFPGHQIAMPPPLAGNDVQYADGTKPTVTQEAHDVATFLTWASEPTMEERKFTGAKVLIFLLVMTGVLYAAKRQIWAEVH